MILASSDAWQFDDINHTDYPIATTNLVANQQDYTLPASLKVLKIRRVEYSPDGTNWYKVEPFDIQSRGLATATNALGDFSTSQPFYDLEYNAIKLYPIPSSNVTGGLKIWFLREIDEFTTSDTTQEPGFDEPFHRMLSIGASLDWAIAKKQPNKEDLKQLLVDYEARLKQYFGRKDEDSTYQLQAAPVSYD